MINKSERLYINMNDYIWTALDQAEVGVEDVCMGDRKTCVGGEKSVT